MIPESAAFDGLPEGVRVRGLDDDGEFGVREDGAAEVEQVVAAEFQAGADDPAQGAEVVVGCVG